MKNFIDNILKTTKERISNPIFGTFMISWVAFNWKPIIFLMLSELKIQSRIKYIDNNFSDIYNLLFFPFIATIVYILVIPYLNLLFDYLLEYSRVKRNIITVSKQKLFIQNKKELAIEEIKLEEAQADFKERESKNKYVEELQKSLEDKDKQIQDERKRYNDLNERFRQESEYYENRYDDYKKEFEDKTESLMSENRSLRKKLNKYETFNDNLRNEKGILEDEKGQFVYLNNQKKYLTELSDDKINRLNKLDRKGRL